MIETLDLLRQVGGDRVSLGIIPGTSQTQTNPNLPVIPSFPVNPGTNPAPNTAPVPGINPEGNIRPANPDIAPVVPNTTAPNQTVAPGTTNSAP